MTMKVTPGEVSSAAPTSVKFSWTIGNFSSLGSKMLYSNVFLAGGYKWRISVNPKAKDSYNGSYLSVYLAVADSQTLPSGWSICAKFSLTVVDQLKRRNSVRLNAQHQFNSGASVSGASPFVYRSYLQDPTYGFIVNNTLKVEAITTIVEKDEIRKKKADLCTIIKVARDEDLVKQIGRVIYFDLVDHDKVHSFCIPRQTPFNLFMKEVAKAFGIPIHCQRFWLWAKHRNNTYRPNRPLQYHEVVKPVGQLGEVSNKANNAELKLFLEVEFGLDLRPVPPPFINKENILLFFKLYDPLKEELRYVGRMFVQLNAKPIEVLTKINELAGFAPDEEIELYQEIYFETSVMCEPVDKRVTFQSIQLQNGDIICFQRSSEVGNKQYCYPDVPSFLEYVRIVKVVHFLSLEKPKEKGFFLELSQLHTYDDIVERVAPLLGLDDPSKIRLTSHDDAAQQPKAQPIKYRGVDYLSNILHNQTSDILYYEVLSISLSELEALKALEVAFHHATKKEVVIHTVRLPRQSTIEDVLNVLKSTVELSRPNSELRLVEIFYHKIYKIFPLHEKIENVNDQRWTLRAEEILEEEKNCGPRGHLIRVYHFKKETAEDHQAIRNFGEPFLLVVREGETLGEIKVRIQKKLQVPDVDFAQWKFTFSSPGGLEYLQDYDIVSARFQRTDVYGSWDRHLGLEHTDDAPERSYVTNQTSDTPNYEVSQKEGPVDKDYNIVEVDVNDLHDSDKEMDAFFENLEPKLLSRKNPSSEEVKEALLHLEEALNEAPSNFDCPKRISKIKNAFIVLSALCYHSTLAVEQKREIQAMEKKIEDLIERAAKAVKEKKFFTQKESLKSTISKNLGGYLVEYKEARAKIKDAELKVAPLQKQVDMLHCQIDEERKKRQKVFHLSKEAKAELDELEKNWPEYEAKMKVAEEEEKVVEAEWDKVKGFILSLKEKSS